MNKKQLLKSFQDLKSEIETLRKKHVVQGIVDKLRRIDHRNVVGTSANHKWLPSIVVTKLENVSKYFLQILSLLNN